jgi:hypothetical protein
VPAGYVAYGSPGAASGAVQPSKGLGTSTIVLFWLVTILSFLLALTLFYRKGVVEDFFTEGSTFLDLDKVNDADALVGLVALLQIVVQLAGVIVLCIWSKRIADNAKARGVQNVSPGLACGGWFIPIGWFFVPFNELRKSVKGVGGSGSAITGWQIGWLLAGVGGVFVFSYRNDINMSDSETSLSDALSRQATLGLVGAVLTAVAAVLATRGIREAIRSVSNGR